MTLEERISSLTINDKDLIAVGECELVDCLNKDHPLVKEYVNELTNKIQELQSKLEEMTKCRDNALEMPWKLAKEIVELNEENQQLFDKNKELEAKLKELNNDK
jgi:uncharacterized coiled-coil DUF342 family protein